MYMLSAPLAAIQGEGAIRLCCMMLCPSVFFVSLLSIVRGYFQGKGNMYPTAVTEVSEQVIKVALGCTLAYIFRENLSLAVASTLFAVTVSEALSTAVALMWYSRRKARQPLYKVAPVSFSAIARFTVPLTLTAIAMPVSQLLESIVAVRLLKGISDNATALYGVFSGCAVTIINLPVSITYGLAAASVPQISPLAEKGDIAGAKAKAYKSLLITLAISVPAAALLFFAAPLAVKIIFSSLAAEEKSVLVTLVKIMAVNAVTSSLVQTSSACLTALGKPVRRSFRPCLNLSALFSSGFPLSCFSLTIYQKFISAATKYAQFADIAAPLMESEVNFISAAVKATRRREVVHCVIVLPTGLPNAVTARTSLTAPFKSIENYGADTMDTLFEKCRNYDTLNKKIAKTVTDAAKSADVCYCVDGAVCEDSACKIILAKHKDCAVIEGVSKSSRAASAARLSSMLYTSVSAYGIEELKSCSAAVIYDIDCEYIAGLVKEKLSDLFGEETPCAFVRGDECNKIKIYEIDKAPCSCFITAWKAPCKITSPVSSSIPSSSSRSTASASSYASSIKLLLMLLLVCALSHGQPPGARRSFIIFSKSAKSYRSFLRKLASSTATAQSQS